MNLEGKDLCFIDTESTGLDVAHDRIVEISIIKIKSDGTKEVRVKRFNPMIEISAEATAIHGITNDMVKDEQPFHKYAKGIADFIGDSVIVTYMGYRFDIPLLYNEFFRANLNWDYLKNTIIDCGQLWAVKESRKLHDAFRYYTGLELDEDKLHTAEYDNELLMAIFKKQIKKYYDKDVSVSTIAVESNYNKLMVDVDGKFYKDSEGIIRYSFGKAKDKPLGDALWQLEYILNGNYSDNTKTFAQFFLKMLKEEK